MAPLPGFSEDGDPVEEIYEQFRDLCSSLNIDKSTADEAWKNYELISVNYTLEGNKLHWLCCALYVACRKSSAPTVGEPETTVEGNCVSLTQLRQKCNISMLEFFDKAQKWVGMSHLPEPFRKKLVILERNFQVCSVIYKKYHEIYLQVFSDPANDPPRVARSRKMRKLPCSSKDVYDFCWAFFVRVKTNFPELREELISCFHLLLACIDYIYANVLLANRRDILNPTFSGLPTDFHSRDWKPPAEVVPCVLEALCEKDAQDAWTLVDVKRVKTHVLKPFIKSMFDSDKLKGDKRNFCGILDVAVFDLNKKVVNNDYEDYVHRLGDFDERVFSQPNAESEIGTPVKANHIGLATSYEQMCEAYPARRNLQSQFDGTHHLSLATPLTGRNFLKAKEPGLTTPVSTATQSVSRLQALLSGRQTGPSDELLKIFRDCQRNPEEAIRNRVREMGDQFCAHYGNHADSGAAQAGYSVDMARKRLQLGESLYFKILENIIRDEQKRLKPGDLNNLLNQEMLHQLLFASCLEIVLFSYNSQRTFPWILGVFPIQPFYFYRIIEVLIRAEDQLSRDVVKHLNHVEEQILESMAWRAESPLWETLKNSEQPVPSCEDVSLPSQLKPPEKSEETVVRPVSGIQTPYSPLAYSNAKRLALSSEASYTNSFLQSPVSSVTERFQSPIPTSTPRRRLFSPTPAASAANASVLEASVTSSSVALEPPKPQETPLQSSQGKEDNKPKRIGSLGLFFRKFYHLASVRLQDLCTRLELYDEDLRKKIWTCFEYSIMHQTDLMQDRHLDQILMCAVYVICKVVGKDKSFTDIMRCYRSQPHASSHVYRSVLLCTKERRGATTSSGNNNASSASPSPAPSEKDDESNKSNSEERKTSEAPPPVRSSSTLPFPQPSSCPPTPTRLAGTATSFEYEDRGDLIRFYNTVYVRRIQKFALRFSSQNKIESVHLSPLPQQRFVTSPRRKLTVKHPIYISPMKTNVSVPASQIRYSFNRSPAKDLQAINALLSVEGTRRFGGKRLVSFEIGGHCDNSDNGPPPPKFPLTVDTVVARKISFQ